jgi:hypothetical protein
MNFSTGRCDAIFRRKPRIVVHTQRCYCTKLCTPENHTDSNNKSSSGFLAGDSSSGWIPVCFQSLDLKRGGGGNKTGHPLNGREDLKACSARCVLPSNVDEAPSRASQCDDSTKTQVYDRCLPRKDFTMITPQHSNPTRADLYFQSALATWSLRKLFKGIKIVTCTWPNVLSSALHLAFEMDLPKV